jgi:SAM-dependent methyltransferase
MGSGDRAVRRLCRRRPRGGGAKLAGTHPRRRPACPSVPSTVWGPEIAAHFDATSAAMYDPAVLNPTVELLHELADGGPVLEFAVGTGRVALPLAARGLNVSGIELSPHMVDQLKAKPGADDVFVTVGDMTIARVPGVFRLVYLVWNSILNVTTQDEQVAVFQNASRHLESGGRFVIEVVVPALPLPGEPGRIFSMEPGHVGIDTHDDPVGQISSSHHWFSIDGRAVYHAGEFRYVWPAELDLMARIAGLRIVNRWAGWDRSAFTAESTSQVAVFEKL